MSWIALIHSDVFLCKFVQHSQSLTDLSGEFLKMMLESGKLLLKIDLLSLPFVQPSFPLIFRYWNFQPIEIAFPRNNSHRLP